MSNPPLILRPDLAVRAYDVVHAAWDEIGPGERYARDEIYARAHTALRRDRIEEDAPADAAEPAFSTQILQRVAGGNDVTVFIRLDLLLFDESIKFPVIK